MNNEQQVIVVPQFAHHFLDEALFNKHCLSNDVTKRDLLNLAYAKKFILDNPNLDASYVIEFLHKIQETGANPYFGDIYCIPYEVRGGGVKANIMFGYQFLLSKVKSTGEYDGYEGPVFTEHVENWNPLTNESRQTATCQVIVYRKNHMPTKYTADFWEFAKIKQDYRTGADQLQSTWRNWKIMLEKCALANALRRAFPEVLRGIYCKEEMWDENNGTAVTVTPALTQAVTPALGPDPVEKAKEKLRQVLEKKETQPAPKGNPPARKSPAPTLAPAEPVEVVNENPPVEDTPNTEVRTIRDRPATSEEMQKIMTEMNKAIHAGHLNYDTLGALQSAQKSYNKIYRIAVALSQKDYDQVRTLLLG